MRPESKDLARRYEAALCRYLARESRASLRPALALGREAAAQGLTTLALALIHEQALLAGTSVLSAAAARARGIRRAAAFFAEAAVPLEETHRSMLEANARLSRLNRSLEQRTLDLSTSNRKLKQEVARRLAVEANLRRSERRTSELLEQSRRMQDQLRHLSRQVLSAQEEERKRISRELHDVIVQTLTGINLRLATLRAQATANSRGLGKVISSTQRLVERSVELVHRFARKLRPAVLDDLGLIPALHSFCKSFTKDTGIRVRLSAFAEVEELSIGERTVLYRVAREALSNVARHAEASRVEATIRRVDDGVHMQIKDDGKAFDVERTLRSRRSRRLGLLGMRERVEMVGGKFSIESVPGQGTTIQARIPFRTGRNGRARS